MQQPKEVDNKKYRQNQIDVYDGQIGHLASGW
jgi:hypothetical protein